MERPGGHRGLEVGTRAGQRGWAGRGEACTLSSRPCGDRWGLDPPSALISSLPPSCVCKEDQVGDGRTCYGHLLHEVQKASASVTRTQGLRTALAMLSVWPRP